jgi:branched-chain amino acid transport system substrate-binding protein
MRRSPPTWAVAVTVGGLVAAMVGCSPDATATPTTLTVPTTTAPIARIDDGILKIGVLTPQGSANADIGQAMFRAVQVATSQINAAGGYQGQAIVVIPADEGVAGVGVDPAIASLLDSGVDAIIGPASSVNALAGLAEIVEAGVLACSPTASASLLDNFPDDNLFFRTIPSDSLQAMAMAEAVDQTGANKATIAYIDDAYGQTFADNVGSALTRIGISQGAPVPYSSNNQSIRTAARSIDATQAGVIVVIGDATSGPVMLREIDADSGTAQPRYVINDAMRRPTASAEQMGGSLASRVQGVSPIAFSTNQDFLAQLGAAPGNSSPYAANAFDCVNLIALAAMAAKSTLPAMIAAQIPAVSDSGTPCMTAVDCAAGIQAGSNINYDGPGGPLSIGANGDVASATFELFGFDQNGRDYNMNTIGPVHA